MIVSNEPGYYKKGVFGIRIENLIYVKKNKFEELTIAPIEKDLINKKVIVVVNLEPKQIGPFISECLRCFTKTLIAALLSSDFPL